jgi:ParB family chromosome partitioning protein
MPTATAPESIAMMVPIDQLIESKLNTRHTYNEKKMAELTESVRKYGVITPLLVRPIGGAGQHEIAAGHRRYRAAKNAGVNMLPVQVREMSDAEFLEILMIENLQREDVHELDEANGYKELMKTAGYDVATLASKVDKSEGYIYARLKLCDLLPEIQAKFYAGELTAGHAILLARLPVHEQIKTVKEGLFREFYDRNSEKHIKELAGVRALGAWIQSNIHRELAKACFSPKDADLVPAAGACETCPKRSGSNPQLFPELGKNDVCTDQKCFDKKIDAFITQKVDSGEMVGLTTEFGKSEYANWYNVPDAGGAGAKKCENAIVGICVEGYEKGKTRKVCVTKSCKVHYPGKQSSTSRSTPSKSRKEREADNEKQELNAAVEAKSDVLFLGNVLDAITKLSRRECELIAANLHFMSDIPTAVHDYIAERFKAFKLEKCSRQQLPKAFAKMSDRELAQLITAHTVGQDLHGYMDGDIADEYAARYKIDRKAIEKQVRDEMAKPPVQTSAAKSKSTTKSKGKRK